MIPPWREALAGAVARLSPGGSLHIVDFGDQAGLPAPFRFALVRWLALFHVTPRRTLAASPPSSRDEGLGWRSVSRFRGYALYAVVERPVA